MIDTEGNVRPGRPRRGHEQVEYAKVKHDITEMMDLEIPDWEIAMKLNLSRKSMWDLKKRILKEIIDSRISENVAAREYMRLEQQERRLVKYMNGCYDIGIAPDAAYVNAFTNLSKRIADLVGANAAIAFTVENVDRERAIEIEDEHVRRAQDLARFYELAERNRAAGIGSGLSREEYEREMENMKPVLAIGHGAHGAGEQGEHDEQGANEDDDITDAEVLDDPHDARSDGDGASALSHRHDPSPVPSGAGGALPGDGPVNVPADNADELTDILDEFGSGNDIDANEDDDDIEMVDVERREVNIGGPNDGGPEFGDPDAEMVIIKRMTVNDRRATTRDLAGGRDVETPGRWVAGKFISWWHDNGEGPDTRPEIDYMEDVDDSDDDTSGLDGPGES